jgi:hypothetical protein
MSRYDISQFEKARPMSGYIFVDIKTNVGDDGKRFVAKVMDTAQGEDQHVRYGTMVLISTDEIIPSFQLTYTNLEIGPIVITYHVIKPSQILAILSK